MLTASGRGVSVLVVILVAAALCWTASARAAPTVAGCVILNGKVVSAAGTCAGVKITTNPDGSITATGADGTTTTVTRAGPGATAVASTNGLTLISSQECVIVDAHVVSPPGSCPGVG